MQKDANCPANQKEKRQNCPDMILCPTPTTTTTTLLISNQRLEINLMQNIPASPRGHATEDKKEAASCVGAWPAETGETQPWIDAFEPTDPPGPFLRKQPHLDSALRGRKSLAQNELPDGDGGRRSWPESSAVHAPQEGGRISSPLQRAGSGSY